MTRRGALVALLTSVAIIASADAATTLTMSQRVLKTNELKGFTPKPKGKLITDVSAFARAVGGTPAQRQAHATRLRKLGFVAGIVQKLSPTRVRLATALSVVTKLNAPSSALQETVAQYNDALLTAKQTNSNVGPMDVPGIPDAKGYTVALPDYGVTGAGVFFSDGQYCYLVTSAGGQVTAGDVVKAAARLYKRVKGK